MYLNVTEQMARDLEQDGTAKDHVIIARERLDELEVKAACCDLILEASKMFLPDLYEKESSQDVYRESLKESNPELFTSKP